MGASDAALQGGAQRFLEQQEVPRNWWTLFGSAELNRLDKEALRANQDVLAAQVEAARFQLDATYLAHRERGHRGAPGGGVAGAGVRNRAGDRPRARVARGVEAPAIAGVPSQLVERRPAVRAAETLLHAATAELGVALANMLPQLTITGKLGSSATLMSGLFKGGSGFWSVGGNATQWLF